MVSRGIPMPSTEVNQGAEIKPKARGGKLLDTLHAEKKSCSRRPKVQMFCQEEVEPGPWLAEHIVYFFSEDFRSAALDGSNQRYIMLYQFVSHFCLNLWLVFISCFSPFCW
jgi:hypothetical protein